jgi:integrase
MSEKIDLILKRLDEIEDLIRKPNISCDKYQQFTKTYVKKVPYEQYEKIVANTFNEKVRIFIKIIYITDLSVMDIIAITIEQIDFKNKILNLEGLQFALSKEIIQDVNLLIGERSSGNVFIGKINPLLNHCIIFRQIKEAGKRSGICNLVPKDLTHWIEKK